jgi:type IV fimbrial biogenesis protein FimT
MAILALVTGFGISELHSWAGSAQLADRSQIVVSSLQLARSEAIKRNLRVAVCKSGDGEGCWTSGGWEQGLIVFEDGNNNAAREPAEALIHREGALPSPLLLSGNQSVRDYVSYAPTGQTRMESGAFQAGTLTLCRRSDTPAEARQVVVSASGRPRSQRAAVASCS